MLAKTHANSEPGVDVIQAANDLQVGSKLQDGDIRIVKVPASILPPNSYKAKSQVLGRGVILPVQKGEFILPSKLAAENAGSGLPSLIPPGMRAVSVRVNEVVAVAGFVVPGTRVDVLLTGNPGGANEQQTTTVLENVAVIAAGQKLERNAAGEPQSTPVITLLVSPDDAQKLTLASSQGHIQLALRNPVDTKKEELPGTKAGGLYRGLPTAAAPAPRPKVVKAPKAETPPASTGYKVQVIRGNKVDETKFPDQGAH
jgi:pilus assembly protein CpaB